MARRVYFNGRQFKNVEEMEEVVRYVWEHLSNEYIFKLYRSIPKRLLAVIDAKGDATKY